MLDKYKGTINYGWKIVNVKLVRWIKNYVKQDTKVPSVLQGIIVINIISSMKKYYFYCRLFYSAQQFEKNAFIFISIIIVYKRHCKQVFENNVILKVNYIHKYFTWKNLFCC